MKTIQLNKNSIEIIDRLYLDLIVEPADESLKYGLNALSYAKKVEMLLSYLDNIEKSIKNEIDFKG